MNPDIKKYGYKLLSRKEYSEFKFKTKLQEKFPDQDINEVFNFFVENKYVNNQRFCEAFVRDQILKLNGPFKIKYKIQDHQIEPFLVDEALECLLPEPEQLRICQILVYKKTVEPEAMAQDFELKASVSKYLQNKGFSFQIIEKTFAET